MRNYLFVIYYFSKMVKSIPNNKEIKFQSILDFNPTYNHKLTRFLANSLEIGVGLAAPQRVFLGSGRLSALGGLGRLVFWWRSDGAYIYYID